MLFFPKPIKKKKPALPKGRYTLIYSDRTDHTAGRAIKSPSTGVTHAKLLKAPRYRLQGKPDMVFSNGRNLIPVELKSGRIGDEMMPHKGDLMQLTVYFLLCEAEYGVRPKKGQLIYSDWMFLVANTANLRRQLRKTLSSMRAMLDEPYLEAEPSYPKCRHCPCRGTVCEYAD